MSRWLQNHRFLSGAKRPLFRPFVERLEPRLCLALAVPALSSLPGANHTIYLDFDGHATSGTVWNSAYGVPVISSPTWSSDANRLDFSASELALIQNAWARVAEDFAPFEVNVTTVAPAAADLARSDSADPRWGIRVVVTTDVAFNCGCAGLAYIDSFNWNSDTPVFVFSTFEEGVAEAISHEVGHALGLSHDGAASTGYYLGHGDGVTSWAPIMGMASLANVSQWDNGTYAGTNNGGNAANFGKGPDDLEIITTYNGFGYRADDHGDTPATASDLVANGDTLSASGRIGRTNDQDLFRFSTAAGAVGLNVVPTALGANLDIKAELLDAAGQIVAVAHPEGSLSARINATLAEGTYYLRVDGTGVGDPRASTPTGYSDYGSLGAYSVSGSFVVGAAESLAIAAIEAAKAEGKMGATAFNFTISRLGNSTGTTSVNYRVGGVGANPAAPADFVSGVFPTGTVTFLPGETSRLLTVNIQGDAVVEKDETFQVVLSQPTGATQIAQAVAAGTIINDDVVPAPPKFNIAATSATRSEGTGAAATPFTFTITRTGDATKAGSVRYSVRGTGLKPANFADFVGGMPTYAVVNFAAGQVTATITVKVAADKVKESNETFRVTLQMPTGATLGVATADGTIINDDGVTAARALAPGLSADHAIPMANALTAVADPRWYFVPPTGDLEDGRPLPPAVETVFSLADESVHIRVRDDAPNSVSGEAGGRWFRLPEDAGVAGPDARPLPLAVVVADAPRAGSHARALRSQRSAASFPSGTDEIGKLWREGLRGVSSRE